jgi:glycolate oxidase FAD binding subunit
VSAAISIAGVTPEHDLAPGDRVQLIAMVRELAAAKRTFAFAGGGTDLDFGNAPRALDAVIRTRALNRVIEYAPEDQTITVEAGMRFGALDAVLAEAGQMLPIDVGDRAQATVGGAIATNAFGSRRHRYGSIKDMIVGVEIVRPDGTLARGGGNVVKNVAGFDLPKLMVGSLGTLGAIVSATLRVFPIARATGAIALDVPPRHSLTRALLDDRALDPMAVTWSAESGLVLTFAGLEAAVDAQCARVVTAADAAGVRASVLDAEALARVLAREREVRRRGAWRATVAHAPAAAQPLPLAERATQIAYPTLGVAIVSGEAAPFTLADVERARASANVVIHAMPGRVRGQLDAWGPPPPAFPIMRALKAQFDPHGLCNPGRFIGGL